MTVGELKALLAAFKDDDVVSSVYQDAALGQLQDLSYSGTVLLDEDDAYYGLRVYLTTPKAT
jgi:hypothetical protein